MSKPTCLWMQYALDALQIEEYIARYGDDMPEITGWAWGREAATAAVRSTEADNV